jgi:WD40 repeat protein
MPFSDIDATYGNPYLPKTEVQALPAATSDDAALCIFGMISTLCCDPCHSVATKAITILRTLQNKLGCSLTPLPEGSVSAVKFDPTYVELLGIFSGGGRGGSKESRDKGKLSGKRSQQPETPKKGMFGGILSPISSPKVAPGDAVFEGVSVLSLDGTDIDEVMYSNAKRSLDVSVLECSIPLEDCNVGVDSRTHEAITSGFRVSSELSLEPAPKMDNQICVLDLENQAPVCMLFHPYQPLLVVADAACSVTLWMPDRGIMRCEFTNCSPNRAGVSAMALVSASSSTGGHLLVGTDDGYVRVWGDLFSVKSNKVRLASSFLALPDCKGKGVRFSPARH